MSTTTIRLTDELKARVEKAAKRAGTTPHNFIVQAITERAAYDELRAEFEKVAEQRYEEFLETGMSIPWNRMREYLLKRATAKPARRPRPRKLVRGSS